MLVIDICSRLQRNGLVYAWLQTEQRMSGDCPEIDIFPGIPRDWPSSSGERGLRRGTPQTISNYPHINPLFLGHSGSINGLFWPSPRGRPGYCFAPFLNLGVHLSWGKNKCHIFDQALWCAGASSSGTVLRDQRSLHVVHMTAEMAPIAKVSKPLTQARSYPPFYMDNPPVSALSLGTCLCYHTPASVQGSMYFPFSDTVICTLPLPSGLCDCVWSA